MSIPYGLIRRLADGRFHSGEVLARELGVSRAAVWKQLRRLERVGLELHAVPGRGYRLARAFEPLDAKAIRSRLGSRRLHRLEVLGEVDSTNEYLRRGSLPPPGFFDVCLAECQTAGRGRRGRAWVSPWGTNLYLSLSGQLPEPALRAGGLSLALAVAVHRALRDFGVRDLWLKWPNDIWHGGRKLAGILVELAGEQGSGFQLVAGAGINLYMPAPAARAIDQDWADLRDLGLEKHRNELAGVLVDRMIDTIGRFAVEGPALFREYWAEYDMLAGRRVELLREQAPVVRGTVRGIEPDGGLCLEQAGNVTVVHAGEVSLRPVE